jgi:hypothetical protein
MGSFQNINKIIELEICLIFSTLLEYSQPLLLQEFNVLHEEQKWKSLKEGSTLSQNVERWQCRIGSVNKQINTAL